MTLTLLLCNSVCSESNNINTCVYDFFLKIFDKFYILPFSGVCLFVKKKKSEVCLNAYQCYNFEEGYPQSRYWAEESYKCKYKVSK